MNKQTRSLRSENASTRVVKGVSVYTGNGTDAVRTGALTFQSFPSTKGRCVDSTNERARSGRKPWKGHGDVLGRNRK